MPLRATQARNWAPDHAWKGLKDPGRPAGASGPKKAADRPACSPHFHGLCCHGWLVLVTAVVCNMKRASWGFAATLALCAWTCGAWALTPSQQVIQLVIASGEGFKTDGTAAASGQPAPALAPGRFPPHGLPGRRQARGIHSPCALHHRCALLSPLTLYASNTHHTAGRLVSCTGGDASRRRPGRAARFPRCARPLAK